MLAFSAGMLLPRSAALKALASAKLSGCKCFSTSHVKHIARKKSCNIPHLWRYGFVSCGWPLQGLEVAGILHQGATPPLMLLSGSRENRPSSNIKREKLPKLMRREPGTPKLIRSQHAWRKTCSKSNADYIVRNLEKFCLLLQVLRPLPDSWSGSAHHKPAAEEGLEHRNADNEFLPYS